MGGFALTFSIDFKAFSDSFRGWVELTRNPFSLGGIIGLGTMPLIPITTSKTDLQHRWLPLHRIAVFI
jgi:hypothetical protein